MTKDESEMIDLYLSGELSLPERTLFELRLADDEALSRRVELRKQFSSYLSSGELEMREALKQAEQNHFGGGGDNNESSFWRRIGIVLVGLLILGGLGWLLYPAAVEVPAVANPVETPAETPAENLEDNTEQTLPETTPVAPPKEPAPATSPAPAPAPPKNEAPAPKSDPPAVETPVFAQLDPADFAPNPLLEDMVVGQLRSTNEENALTLTPAADTISLSALNTYTLRATLTEAPPYEVLIFGNRQDDFLEDKPLVRRNVEEVSDSGSFDIDLSTIKSAGRFYVLVLTEEEELVAGDVLLIRP